MTTRAGEESLVAEIDDPAAARALCRRACAGARARGRLPYAGGRVRAGPSSPTKLRLRAFVGAADGGAWVRDELDGSDPERLGAAVAQRLLSAGAREVLGS